MSVVTREGEWLAQGHTVGEKHARHATPSPWPHRAPPPAPGAISAVPLQLQKIRQGLQEHHKQVSGSPGPKEGYGSPSLKGREKSGERS